jgi:hypothetical protein
MFHHKKPNRAKLSLIFALLWDVKFEWERKKHVYVVEFVDL